MPQVKGGVDVFLWGGYRRDTDRQNTENQHFSNHEEGGIRHGSFSHRKDPRLHGHVKPPSAGHRPFPESEGPALPYAVAAGGLGLHHEGPRPYLQGWHRQYQRRYPGVGGTRVSDPGAHP